MHFSSFAEEFLSDATDGTPKENKRLALDIAEIVGRNFGIHGVLQFENEDGKLYLGGGAFGKAAISAVDENKVVKLTTDPEEVKASSIVLGKDLAHVVHFFEAAYIADVRVTHVETGLLQPVGITVMERLDSVGIKDRESGSRLTDITGDVKRRMGVEPIKIVFMSAARARQLLEPASRELSTLLRLENDADLNEIATGVEELHGHGVYAVDFHPGNVGWSNRDGVYKVFDLGISSSPKGVKPKVLTNPRRDGVCVLIAPEDCWPMRSISAPEHRVQVIY